MRMIILGLIISVNVLAAPFCVKNMFGTNCIYFDANYCKQMAVSTNGMCVENAENNNLTMGAPFCVTSMFGRSCIYYDVNTCKSAATTLNGMCIPNN